MLFNITSYVSFSPVKIDLVRIEVKRKSKSNT